MHVQNIMNSLWDIRISLGLVPKESPCISLVYHERWRSWRSKALAATTLNHKAFFYTAQQPLAGQWPLLIKAPRSHLDTPHSVELPWRSYQPDADASTWQRTTLIRDRPPIPSAEFEPANDRRPKPYTARPMGSAREPLLLCLYVLAVKIRYQGTLLSRFQVTTPRTQNHWLHSRQIRNCDSLLCFYVKPRCYFSISPSPKKGGSKFHFDKVWYPVHTRRTGKILGL